MTPPGLHEEEPEPGPPVPDHSPEARRRQAIRFPHHHIMPKGGFRPGSHAFEVTRRVAVGAFNDGFIHAGNLAYMSVLAIFPFFITGAAIFSVIGEESERLALINAIVAALPPVVGEVIEPVARSVVEQRNGWVLWIGGLFGLWTVGSLVETIRDILRRAYGTRPTQAFWKYRILSTGIILGAVLLLILSLFAQVIIGAAQEVIAVWFPDLEDVLSSLAWSRLIPAVGLFGSIYLLFKALTPATYRAPRYPKWPGAVLVTAWWVGVTAALPPLLGSVLSYDMTYGSLAGMMIALFFFWLVGLGMVVGAELNAALAETPEEASNRVGQADDRERLNQAKNTQATKKDGGEI